MTISRLPHIGIAEIVMIDGGEGGGNSIGLGPQPPTHTRPQIVSLLDIAPQDVPAVVSAVTSIVSLQWPQKATLLHILPLVHDPDAMCLIMLLSSKVIGFAKLIRVQRSHRNLVGFLACLIIDKDHRHQGFGAYFLDDVERRAAESMYSRIYLSAELSPIFFSVSQACNTISLKHHLK
uniref:N-acetyltransferase domain-containing protein n=2 Tax=Spongospora subterranea TaxID=70186 RepID=A0A0H5R9X3_9EUKA|eukprot:CRZ05224.1 hypothetical protein [Spongospora subterranea]